MKSEQLRFLALGDSYTIGESVAPAERWCNQLARSLRSAGVPIQDPEIIATTGWTASELWSGIDTTHTTPPYDLVSLLIGVNNQFRGLDKRQYRSEFASLADKAIVLAGDRPSRVLVLSIPDWGAMPFAIGRDLALISKQIDQFNAVNKEEAERRGTHYVEVTSISRRAKNDASLVAPDGLHPSGKMYSMWADLVLPVARLALET